MKVIIKGNLLTIGDARIVLSHVTSYQAAGQFLHILTHTSFDLDFKSDSAACAAVAELDQHFSKSQISNPKSPP